MSFLRQLIERKLSSATGASVTFGEFRFAPLSGNLEVTDVKVAFPRFATPMLTVDRVAARLHVARALKQEIVLKSLAIEKPVLSVVCRSDGTLNLDEPRRARRDAARSGKEAGGAWGFECDRVLIVGGAVTYRDDRKDKYTLAIDGINATLEPSAADLSLTLAADGVGRRDKPVDLGQLTLTGKFAGAGGWTNFASAGLDLVGTLGSALNLKLGSAGLGGGDFRLDLSGPLKLTALAGLIPTPTARALTYEITGGDVHVRLRASTDGRRNIQVRQFELATVDAALTRPSRGKS